VWWRCTFFWCPRFRQISLGSRKIFLQFDAKFSMKNRETRLILILFVCFLYVSFPAVAAVSVSDDGDIIVSGLIDRQLVEEFRAILNQSKGDTRRKVVFDQSLGGLVGSSATLAILIEGNGLNTVARRQCSSGCALAFLAGRHRTVDTRQFPVVIGFHNAYKKDGTPTDDPANLMKRLDYYTKRRLTGEIRDLIYGATSPARGILFIFEKTGSNTPDSVRYCDERADSNPDNCRVLAGVDARSMGIIDER